MVSPSSLLLTPCVRAPSGKIKDKREKLESFLNKLMDKNNRKLSREHRKYCSKLQSSRLRPLLHAERESHLTCPPCAVQIVKKRNRGMRAVQ